MSLEDLLVALAGLLLLLALLTGVFHVRHDGLETTGVVIGVVGTTVVEVGDALPLGKDRLRCKLNIDRETVAARTLPPSLGKPTGAHFI